MNELYAPLTGNFFSQSVMRRLLVNNMELDSVGMRTNSLLRKDEWLLLDRTLVELRKVTLNAVEDLISRSLTYNLGNIGVVMAEWERINDITPATISMSPSSQAREDTLTFDLDGVPVPLIYKDFRYDIRRIMAARNHGTSLDTLQSEAASKKVFQAIENMLFNGVSLNVSGRLIYGYFTFPSRVTGTLAGGAWDGTATAAQILTDVQAVLAQADLLESDGPYSFYVPLNWMKSLREDYKAESERTLLKRILDNEEIAAIKPSSQITNDHLSVVEMSRQTVDIAIASDVVNIQWDEVGGMETRFKVIGSMVPRLKVDGNGICPIFDWSAA